MCEYDFVYWHGYVNKYGNTLIIQVQRGLSESRNDKKLNFALRAQRRATNKLNPVG